MQSERVTTAASEGGMNKLIYKFCHGEGRKPVSALRGCIIDSVLADIIAFFFPLSHSYLLCKSLFRRLCSTLKNKNHCVLLPLSAAQESQLDSICTMNQLTNSAESHVDPPQPEFLCFADGTWNLFSNCLVCAYSVIVLIITITTTTTVASITNIVLTTITVIIIATFILIIFLFFRSFPIFLFSNLLTLLLL